MVMAGVRSWDRISLGRRKRAGTQWLSIPVVVVKREELGEVAIERRNVLCSYAPERADFEDITCMQRETGSERGRCEHCAC